MTGGRGQRAHVAEVFGQIHIPDEVVDGDGVRHIDLGACGEGQNTHNVRLRRQSCQTTTPVCVLFGCNSPASFFGLEMVVTNRAS